ncbi:MAG: hypothetical protein JNK84_18470 [Phreatobacter sp.]|uniref:hypothetical protein n=1 Tax=Phreatobacter sp. TaxID=1966341 RepID=UPI001A5AC70A|nr:hypothetical protein [Phreatobacter sp.]MBL8571061.1 hypothetical protein [Phreatobacter sp.]
MTVESRTVTRDQCPRHGLQQFRFAKQQQNAYDCHMRTVLSAFAFLAILVSLPLSWWLLHRQDRSPTRDRVIADPSGSLFLAAGIGHVSTGGGAGADCGAAGADCGGGSAGDGG